MTSTVQAEENDDNIFMVPYIIRKENLFQRAIYDTDISFFCFPCNQPHANPNNCGLVTLQFLKLISPLESSALIHKYPLGVSVSDIVNTFKYSFGIDNIRFARLDNIIPVLMTLFPNMATLIMAERGEGQVGHVFVFGKSEYGNPYIIDAQVGYIITKLVDVDAYLRQFLYANVIVYSAGKTEDEHMDINEQLDTQVVKRTWAQFFNRGICAITTPQIVSTPPNMARSGGGTDANNMQPTTATATTTVFDIFEYAKMASEKKKTGGRRAATRRRKLRKLSNKRRRRINMQ